MSPVTFIGVAARLQAWLFSLLPPLQRLFRPDNLTFRRQELSVQCLGQVGPLSSRPDRHSLCLTDKVIYWIFYQNILTSYNIRQHSTGSGFSAFIRLRRFSVELLNYLSRKVEVWSIGVLSMLVVDGGAGISNSSSWLLWQGPTVSKLEVWGQCFWRRY